MVPPTRAKAARRRTPRSPHGVDLSASQDESTHHFGLRTASARSAGLGTELRGGSPRAVERATERAGAPI
jgi:hypothetical protein